MTSVLPGFEDDPKTWIENTCIALVKSGTERARRPLALGVIRRMPRRYKNAFLYGGVAPVVAGWLRRSGVSTAAGEEHHYRTYRTPEELSLFEALEQIGFRLELVQKDRDKVAEDAKFFAEKFDIPIESFMDRARATYAAAQAEQ